MKDKKAPAMKAGIPKYKVGVQVIWIGSSHRTFFCTMSEIKNLAKPVDPPHIAASIVNFVASDMSFIDRISEVSRIISDEFPLIYYTLEGDQLMASARTPSSTNSSARWQLT